MNRPSREALLAALTARGGPFEISTQEIGGVPMRVYANAPASMRDLFLTTRAFAARDDAKIDPPHAGEP